MANNNGLLKNIAKNTGSTITGVHGDNYYLRRIEENTQGGISSSGGGSVDLSAYAKKSELPSKVSDLENDMDYITAQTLGTATSDLGNAINTKLSISDVDTLDVLITYEDGSTETMTLYVLKSD